MNDLANNIKTATAREHACSDVILSETMPGKLITERDDALHPGMESQQ